MPGTYSSRTNSLPAATSAALTALNINNTIVMGSTAVISNSVINQLPEVTSVAGSNRYDTAAEAIRRLNLPADSVFVATGENFPDALAGSVLAAKQGASLILVRSNLIPSATQSIINEKGILHYVILGSDAAISKQVELDLRRELQFSGKLRAYNLDRTTAFYDSIMYMGSTTYYYGLQLTAGYYNSAIADFNLGNRYSRITGLIGLDDSVSNRGAIVRFTGDGSSLAVIELPPGTLPKNLDINVSGVSQLRIEINSMQDGFTNNRRINFVTPDPHRYPIDLPRNALLSELKAYNLGQEVPGTWEYLPTKPTLLDLFA